MTDIQWLIGGEAGYGIMTVGFMMSKIFTRLGFSVFDYAEYPSLIRGGHNAYYVRASDEEIFSQRKGVDILVALNRETIDKHKQEISQNGIIIYDPATIELKPEDFSSSNLASVPLLDLTKQSGAEKLMINTVALGASLALFHSDFSVLEKIIQDIFGKKGEKIIQDNLNTSKAGFDYVFKSYTSKFAFKIEKKQQENLLISGAEAVSYGAIKAGLKFVSIYPMTPINGVLTTIASQALKYNIIVKEPEDEISAINMAIGASFAGVRSLTATSGGGFSLMVEGLGLTAQSETPLVVVEGMRPGPATSMPTWTEQGDLRFVLHAAQGDFPRIVVAPGDMFEAFSLTMQAFNLAEKYQLPVIILVDKYLMEGHSTFDSSKFKVESSKFRLERGKLLKDEEAMGMMDYKRYELTDDGVSIRSIPGQKEGIALSGSDEHNEKGLYNEESENRTKMMDKRFKKLETASLEISKPEIYGNRDSALTIIGFGSTKLPILEAVKWLRKESLNVNFLQILYLNPFPQDMVAQKIKTSRKTLIVENNKTGQLEGLIREKTGLSVDDHLRKYDGRPFYPEEIVEKVKSLI